MKSIKGILYSKILISTLVFMLIDLSLNINMNKKNFLEVKTIVNRHELDELSSKVYNPFKNLIYLVSIDTNENAIKFSNSFEIIEVQKNPNEKQIDLSYQWRNIKELRQLRDAKFSAFFKITSLKKKLDQDFKEVYLIDYKYAIESSQSYTFLFAFVINKLFLYIEDNRITKEAIEPVPLFKVCVPVNKNFRTFISSYCIFSKCKNTIEEDKECPDEKLPHDIINLDRIIKN